MWTDFNQIYYVAILSNTTFGVTVVKKNNNFLKIGLNDLAPVKPLNLKHIGCHLSNKRPVGEALVKTKKISHGTAIHTSIGSTDFI